MPKVSIIIRTKNEERWIGRCLRMIARQDFRDFEVVIVDNGSTDHTVAVARKYPVKLVRLGSFRPGDAINKGIRASRGEYVVCLSAHCIPQRRDWLSKLLRNMDNPEVAGVYGRQLPMAYSSPADKRDLLNTFGLDHRIQVKDSFFHNANSLFRRSVWERIPFDEKATNIEDRIWGKAVIAKGWKLAYEPEAAVYHYHGIHQNGNEERARNVVRILESLGHGDAGADGHELDVLAVLPVLGPALSLGGKDLLKACVKQVKASGVASAVCVIAENARALAAARAAGATTVKRPKELLGAGVGVEKVLQRALAECEKDRHYDAVLYVNYLFPFRPTGFYESLLARFSESGADSVVPSMPDYSPHWLETEQGVQRRDSGQLTKSLVKPMQRGLVGLGTLSSSEFVRQGRLIGDSVGLAPVEDKLCAMKANDPFDQAVVKLALAKGPGAFRR